MKMDQQILCFKLFLVACIYQAGLATIRNIFLFLIAIEKEVWQPQGRGTKFEQIPGSELAWGKLAGWDDERRAGSDPDS